MLDRNAWGYLTVWKRTDMPQNPTNQPFLFPNLDNYPTNLMATKGGL